MKHLPPLSETELRQKLETFGTVIDNFALLLPECAPDQEKARVLSASIRFFTQNGSRTRLEFELAAAERFLRDLGVID